MFWPNSLLMQVEEKCPMRVFMTSCAILLALVAFGPTRTMAKEPGGGQGRGRSGGGQQGTGSARAPLRGSPEPRQDQGRGNERATGCRRAGQSAVLGRRRRRGNRR